MDKGDSFNILIVDDNQNNLLSLHTLISEYIENVFVFEANSGMMALSVLIKQTIDLIILDVQMPDMDGFETASLIKSRKRTVEIPIVFLTAAYKSDDFKAKGYNIGAADYLTKPIDVPQLIGKINSYLRFIYQERQHSRYERDLEEKVQERTATLSTINEQLIQEIAERKRTEENLKYAKEVAEAANVAKSRFLANMSHELRTPLNAIIGYAEMLQEDATDLGYEECLPDLEKVRSAGKHLLELISNILDISKIEAGKMDLMNEHFDLAFVIRETIATFLPIVEKNRNQFQIKGIDDLSVKMFIDKTKMCQILLNLLNNASKFTENGIITLAIEYIGAEEEGDETWVDFRITDNGIGISPEQISKLFQPFTQADVSTTRKYGGTGLGLTIVKQFTELMGGSVSVTSALEQGSTFVVRLPTIFDESLQE
jgi:signal transduction histidine kinase